MRTPGYTTQFEKDIKRMRKRGKDIQKLKQVLSSLIAEEQQGDRFKDHPLIGNYKDRRECHIEPDWLLIYKLTGSDIIFERTEAHTDLFG
ncbi:MAG: type II toxin-antitoxin system YafQ family toxin [Anaerolineales bacterium]|nr:type II toxin-antitoxin system YafQ family toxin [Anaerolineales bacterium]